MRDYAKVEPKMWHGKTVKDLRKKGSKALLVGLYLMTSPSSNMLGLFSQPVLYMAHETGLGLEGAMEGLHGCIDCNFCSYDEDSETVWVHEMAKYQIAPVLKASDLRCKGVQRDYDALHDNPFLGPFFDKYQSAFHLTSRRGFSESFEAPSKPLRSQEQEQEQEQEKEQEYASTDVLAPAFPDEKQPETELPGLPKAQIPDCPHLKVLELWAEVLPALPQHNPEMWKGARADHLRARWRETSILKKWPDQDAGLAYFRKLFRYVGTSQFLTGQARSTDPSKRPFTIELEWLVNPSNWAKVHEGKYHSEA